MKNKDLLVWVQDPARKTAELKMAATGLRLVPARKKADLLVQLGILLGFLNPEAKSFWSPLDSKAEAFWSPPFDWRAWLKKYW